MKYDTSKMGEMSMITPKDIEKKTMSREKRKEAKNSIFAFYIGRPLSYVLTIPFLYINLSPNLVTIFSIIFSFVGFAFLSFGVNIKQQLIGVLFFFLWNMGDGIDGNIARFKDLKSSTGDMLDTLGGYIAMCLLLLGMGNAAYNDGNMLFVPKMTIIVIAELSAVFTLIPRLLMHRKLAMNLNKRTASLKDKKSYGLMKIIALNICDPAGFQEVIMFLSLIMGLNTVFTIGYFFVNMVVMVYTLKNLCD